MKTDTKWIVQCRPWFEACLSGCGWVYQKCKETVFWNSHQNQWRSGCNIENKTKSSHIILESALPSLQILVLTVFLLCFSPIIQKMSVFLTTPTNPCKGWYGVYKMVSRLWWYPFMSDVGRWNTTNLSHRQSTSYACRQSWHTWVCDANYSIPFTVIKIFVICH